jgi:hypothetical protein
MESIAILEPPEVPCTANFRTYAEYSEAYRLYLDLVTMHNERVTARPSESQQSTPATQTNTMHVRFAEPAVRHEPTQTPSPPPPYSPSFQNANNAFVARDLHHSSVGNRLRESTPGSFLAAATGGQSTSDRVSHLAYARRGSRDLIRCHDYLVQLQLALADVATPAVSRRLVDQGRGPKSYRSLFNLREMCVRVRNGSGKLLLDPDDLRCLRDRP